MKLYKGFERPFKRFPGLWRPRFTVELVLESVSKYFKVLNYCEILDNAL